MTMEDNNSKEYGQYDATHEEIAKEMGKSRAYVSLIEKEALEKLRKKLLWKHNVASVDDLL
jgi:transcriptional regulator